MRWPLPYPRVDGTQIASMVVASKYLLAAHGSGLGCIVAGGNSAWPASNLAIYIPFELEGPWRTTGAWTLNGNASGAGNWDIGIYTADGARIISLGPTALVGSNAEQHFTWSAAKILDRGVYYMALGASSNGMTLYRYSGGSAGDWTAWGALQQAAAMPLPATATFARNTTQYLPTFGLYGTPL